MQRSDEVERSSTLDDASSPSPRADRSHADVRDGNGGTAGRRSGVRPRLARLFSVRVFLGALLLCVVGTVVGTSVGGFLPGGGFLGRIVGLFGAGFAVGLGTSHRRYLEVGVAGGVASGLGFLLNVLGSTVLPVAADLLSRYGVTIAGGGAAAGVLVALVGHYFGRDLRDGLTREVE